MGWSSGPSKGMRIELKGPASVPACCGWISSPAERTGQACQAVIDLWQSWPPPPDTDLLESVHVIMCVYLTGGLMAWLRSM